MRCRSLPEDCLILVMMESLRWDIVRWASRVTPRCNLLEGYAIEVGEISVDIPGMRRGRARGLEDDYFCFVSVDFYSSFFAPLLR